LVIADVDGVLTDTGVYYSAKGEELKRYSIRDGMGIERLRKLADVETGIMTRENTDIVRSRAAKLKITELHMGVMEKEKALDEILVRKNLKEEEVAYMEKVVVRGVAVDKDQAKVIVSNILDKPGSAARVFRALADANVLVDMIVQNVGRHGIANLTFTVPQTDTVKAQKALEPVLDEVGGGQVAIHEHIAKLSVVGVGMKTHSGVAASLFQALAEANINIELISTSEIKISVVIDQDRADEAARVAHAAFHLDQL